MFLKQINVPSFKILKDINISLESNEKRMVFPIVSYNGGGKSTLIQYVFGLLNFSFSTNKHQFLRNLLIDFDKRSLKKNDLHRIAYFEIEENEKTYDIEFLITESYFQEYDFSIINKLKDIRKLEKKNDETLDDLNFLERLERDYSEKNIPNEVLLHEVQRFVRSSVDEKLILTGRLGEFIHKYKRNNSLLNRNELQNSLFIAENEYEDLQNSLEVNNLFYITHLNSKDKVLLVKTTSDFNELKSLSSKIYLAAPKTQVMHFLSSDQINSLFKNEKYIYSSYDNFINECQEVIKEYFTYDFNSINSIVQTFQKARDNDFNKALETGAYGNEINQAFKDINQLLGNKTLSIDKDLKYLTFKSSSGNVLAPSDLSHGELKKLAIYTWIKSTVSNSGAVVLFDEIDMGLHPKWQQELHTDLQKWNRTNQYILATHSPQVVSNVFYKNLILLDAKKTYSTTKQYISPPFNNDLNTIIKEIMGADYEPNQLKYLKSEYLKYVKKKDTSNPKAIEIKREILDYESESSVFFSELEFNRILNLE